ncbi:pyrroline-5-carboxylate reductase [Candidatus Termititenax persephonae]|uniref:Pyrroline-5-carboxylate reductase n=1 Tax=Candidatus Termititenax persephonae TaxID=2218525 RepID=A0A388TH72_9BACT|nr:pyrroline-5-carboxylate reductase [Candidatus Termititenax persephonae]
MQGALKAGLLAAPEIMVSDVSADRLKYLAEKYGVQTTANNVQALRAAENILLAVKPQSCGSVLDEIQAVNKPDQLIITIVAGVPMAQIDVRQNLRVARVMPNTPALIGQAASAVCFNPRAAAPDKEFTLRLLRSIGAAIEVEERDLNAITGLSGSGPAFVFRLMDYFVQAGEGLGLAADKARALVYQTFAGSARLAQESGRPLADLIAQVTSPNGTTQAGREVLEQSAAGQIIGNTVRRAKERADELAGGR